MKTALTLLVGMILGAILVLAFQNPRRVGAAAHEGVARAQSSVESLRYDQCVREFLDYTQCFQRRPATECEVLVEKKCGGHP